MNPRAAINDLLTFQASPFGHLGTSADYSSLLYKNPQPLFCAAVFDAEDGIRTHVPLRTNGFQDRLVMTSSIPLQFVHKRTKLFYLNMLSLSREMPLKRRLISSQIERILITRLTNSSLSSVLSKSSRMRSTASSGLSEPVAL